MPTAGQIAAQEWNEKFKKLADEHREQTMREMATKAREHGVDPHWLMLFMKLDEISKRLLLIERALAIPDTTAREAVRRFGPDWWDKV